MAHPGRLALPWSYPTRFPAVQKIEVFVYRGPRNAAIVKWLSDSLATTDLN